MNLLNQIKNIVKKQEPSAEVYLYGSRAKGTAQDSSDWDLLILLNQEKIFYQKEKNIADLLYDLEFETGQVISHIFYSKQEWNTKHKITPFYQSVMREGQLL